MQVLIFKNAQKKNLNSGTSSTDFWENGSADPKKTKTTEIKTNAAKPKNDTGFWDK